MLSWGKFSWGIQKTFLKFAIRATTRSTKIYSGSNTKSDW